MFSIENLYYILYINLFKRIKADIRYFKIFGSTDVDDVTLNFFIDDNLFNGGAQCFFYDQEPVYLKVLAQLESHHKILSTMRSRNHSILVTSERSDLVKNYCKKNNMYHLYYFFHGFASLNWYRDVEYFQDDHPVFKTRFLSFNRLCTKNRSYRLLLVSNLLERKILSKGSVSLQLIDAGRNIIKKEVFDPNCRLSKQAKIKVFKNLSKIEQNFVIDNEMLSGQASAHCGAQEYRLWQSSFLHLVSETVFFDEKLHLTEKIFKPIVSRRPFILLGAYKNLEYLQSYGFKTFSQWIDESYDDEQDNEIRLSMVCNELEKIVNLSDNEIKEMYHDMQEVLEYNCRHFYTDFKRIIVNELVDNFEGYLRWYNNGRLNDEVYDIESLNLSEVKRLLAQ